MVRSTQRSLKSALVLLDAFARVPFHRAEIQHLFVSDVAGEKVLNLGAVEWDTRESVEENKRRFQAALGAADHTLLSLHQIHSDVVRSFDSVPAKQCKGDASVTKRPGLLLGVRTADCAPVLLVDPKKRVVAAIHAGWRGTLARIVTKTVGQMQM